MRFLSICIVLLFLACSVSKPSGLLYSDRYTADLAPDEELVGSSYQHTLTRNKTTGRYIRREYYPDTKTLIEYQEFSSIKPYVADGVYRSWSDEGALRSEGLYANNESSGEWTAYFDDGVLKSKGSYRNGEKVGDWISYHKNGTQYLTSTYSGGPERVEYRYDTLGVVQDTLKYLNEELISGTPFGQAYFAAGKIEQMPVFGTDCVSIVDEKVRKKCGENSLFRFMSQNLRYPPQARSLGIEGTGLISFVVEKNGAVGDVRVVRGISGDIRQEMLRIVYLMPKWTPGTVDGEPVRVQYTLPIKFKLVG